MRPPNVGLCFLATYDYITENECTEEMVDHYRRVVTEIQTIFSRPKFIHIYPQHCTRVRILNRIFPDAKFIHIIRDGNAVECSTLYASSTFPSTDTYFSSLRGKIFPLLEEKYYSESLAEMRLYRLARDFLVAKAREAQAFGLGRYHEIHYEEFTAGRREKINEVLSFCDLGSYQDFEDNSMSEIHNENIKWKNMLRGKDNFTPLPIEF